MRTTFRARQPYADILLEIAQNFPCQSKVRPLRFIEKMKKNQGSIAALTGLGLGEDGLERKNPVIVGLGDSVTAGHFESLLPRDEEKLKTVIVNAMADMAAGKPAEPIEVTDPRESYLEKFRYLLIDKYERTSVSVINSGIAGDNLKQMSDRSTRDVIRYRPDLVLINGSLNWDIGMGTAQVYRNILEDLVDRIKSETEADIILLTPNGDLPNTLFGDKDAPIPTTLERVKVIREVAEERQVSLADVYAVWEAARDEGCPWEELLANGVNHPGVEGHEAYAITLMKLME